MGMQLPTPDSWITTHDSPADSKRSYGTKAPPAEASSYHMIEVDNDARLRRALLRQHQAVQYHYATGQASTIGVTPLVEQGQS